MKDESDQANQTKQQQPTAKSQQRAPTGRIAEIERAIAQEDIDLARRLSNGDDLDIPDAI